MSNFRTVFESIRARTGMYIPNATYDACVAFVLGYDIASEGGVLIGFREWLIPRVGTGNNQSWSALVLHLAFPEADRRAPVRLSAELEKQAIDSLFRIIGEFDDQRRKPEGLRKVYLDYERWLRTQDWYDADSPYWLEAP